MLLTFGLLGAFSSPAAAITDGELDGGDHPHVALMVAKGPDGELLGRCSGTFLSPTLYLTAGHCTEGATDVEIFLGSGPIPLGAGYPAAGADPCAGVTGYPCTGDVSGTPYTHPQYDPSAFYLYDLGVVVLDEPVELPVYGELPTPGQLDSLEVRRSTTFTAVGYGLQKSFPDAAGWKDQAERTRYVAHPRLIKINTKTYGKSSFLVSANANTGGTCFGDSGGPYFIGDSNVVAGVTSFGVNSTCAGTAGVYRIDQADDLDWLYGEFGEHL
jgi:hypothetical protein